MKTKKKFIKSTSQKFLLVTPIILLAFAFFTSNLSGQATTKSKTEVAPPPQPPPPPPPPPGSDKEPVTGVKEGAAYQAVDEMPVFPGGEEALMKYIADSIRYPGEAKVKSIQGKVIARFMVKADGSVSDVSILKGVDPSLDMEALRVVKSLPKFTPGKLNGKAVAVWYLIPIEYKLN
jgi:protein TonB